MHQKGTEKMKVYNEKPWQIDKGQKTMDDALQAQGYIRDIGGPGRPTVIISIAAEVLDKLFPHKDEPKKQWTERRLWEWWSNRSDVVRHWQMCELHRAAETKKQERVLIDAARREHAEFIARTTRLAEMLERQDEAFHSAQIEGLRRQSCRVDRSGNQGE